MTTSCFGSVRDGVFVSRSLVLSVLLALLAQGAVAQSGADPDGLTLANLLSNPGFNGPPCTEGWGVEVVQVACNAGAGFAWLNHNNRAADPAVTQVLNGLEPGKEYEIVVGWRGGDHGPIHGVSGARNIFAVDIDGREIRRLTTNSNYTAWMINDQLEGASGHTPITFTATAGSHTIRFRGEVGADGDVLLGWASVRERFRPQLFPVGTEGRRSASEIDAGKAIVLQVLFVDFPDQQSTSTDFEGLWQTITSNGKLISAFANQGAAVTVNLIRPWMRMPRNVTEYFPPSQPSDYWDYRKFIDDSLALLPAASYSANTIAIAVPNRNLAGWKQGVPSGQHPASHKGVRSLITLSPKVYEEHYTTLMHEIGHSLGSFELYPDAAPYVHKVGGYDVMGDAVFATGFCGWHRYRYGWMDSGRVEFLSRKGDYRVDLKKLSLNRGKSMVVLPDGQEKLKYWVIEIGQDVQSRDQFKAGQNQKLNTEGERLIVYTVQEPRPRERILLEPRVGFEGNNGTTEWLDRVSYKEGQSFSKPGAPFGFSNVSKTPEGFSLVVRVPDDIDYLTYGVDQRSPDGKYVLKAQDDGNIVVQQQPQGTFVWGIKNGLFNNIASNLIVALRKERIQLIEIPSMTLRDERAVAGMPAGTRFVVGNDGKMRVIDYKSKVWWTRP